MTPGTPDAEAVIAVLAGIDSVKWPDGSAKVQLAGAHRQEVAVAALAAAGRVLAERWTARADDYARDADDQLTAGYTHMAARRQSQATFLRDLIDEVQRWCGVPEGAGGGEGG